MGISEFPKKDYILMGHFISPRIRYEANKRIYTIYTIADEIVGYRDCDGIMVSTIQGQNHGIKVGPYIYNTLHIGS
jgi:hypothetical protein